jgi:hypothetical protein
MIALSAAEIGLPGQSVCPKMDNVAASLCRGVERIVTRTATQRRGYNARQHLE